ncbi:MAG: fibronectin type III domain-containing protein, partial [Bacteroidaceae bacterium]|nr:fibronectin type III domain-containing protein [Bacteroidaceae bacterium]
LTYQLEDADRANRYKIVNLPHSCVYYDIDMYVERDKSPINQLEDVTEYYFPIRSEADWAKFSQNVEAANGEYDVNARLFADITTDWRVGRSESAYYRGTFDGNGHTLTFNRTDTEQYAAPFRYVGNASFRNLRTAGTIKATAQYTGGLIGYITNGSKVTIDNCRSSVTINSTNFTNGGFVSRLGEKATVAIRSSKFDGAFEGDESHHNGGFIGYCQAQSTAIIDNCLFAPDHISTKSDACETWVRGGDFTLSIINSFATREYSSLVIIRNATEWRAFVNKAKQAEGKYDVNAILSADISLNSKDDIAGYSGNYPYRGTFDGNGHTINVNISDDARNTGLFSHVTNATFKNMKLTGTISSSNVHHGSLIGSIDGNSKVTIENCHSSVTLKSSVTGDATMGGFVGAVQEGNSSVTFSNCKFDGSFDGAKTYNNGGFVGWTNSVVNFVNCLFTPASVNTDPAGSDTWARGASYTTLNCYATGEFCRIINNGSDWEALRTALANRGNKSVNAILNADFTIDHSAWNLKGVFDGNGHTLNLNGTDGLFVTGEDYTIKNLRVTGSMGGGQHVAGLVGSSERGNIQSCRVSVGIHCNTTHAGGFIGHAHDTQHTINNCLFDGAISAKNDGKADGTSYLGAFIGWGGGGNNYVTNCLEDGSYHYTDHEGFCYKGNGDDWGNEGNSTNNYTYKYWSEVYFDGIRHNNTSYVLQKLGSDNWYVQNDSVFPKMAQRELWNNVGSLSASNLASNLGSSWQVVDGKAVPIMSSSLIGASVEDLAKFFTSGWTLEDSDINPTTTTVEYRAYAAVNEPNLKDVFYHKTTGTIEPELLTQTRQSSVLLSWSTDNNPIDYFRVMRRMQGEGDDQWQEVATGLTDMSYEDTSVSPLFTYEYKVQGVNDCEGLTFTATNPKVGECKHTGRVEGYVRFNDGTGAPGVWVSVKYAGEELTGVETDESGYFEVDELSYHGGTTVDYEVGPAAQSGINIPPVPVTFDATSNNRVLREFTIENGRRFSGYVMYEGTSIPVKGVNFLVDGNRIHNAQGKYVETDYDGSFSFRVLDGQHTIQAVMDKHKFTNDG